ncbi:cytochrome P450 [Crossiella equi]|uniref:Cytochrome P450 n=1 Tax=Crossiella equi TaxID=130796 RepID=A0ABS5A7L5_9PSEU|nr:cytochrome P450 [Crossiella equi]MBP2472578.1 cytochrome P450 [Crossiella equi]
MPDTAVQIPLHMRRQGLGPHQELVDLRADGRLGQVTFALPQGELLAWVVTRYEDVRTVLGDHKRFSNNFLGDPDEQPLPPGVTREEMAAMRKGQLLNLDPPDHTALRRLLMPEFTMRRMWRLEDRITEIVDDHLDALEAAGKGADLVQHFALPIPSLVICELLGVPYEDRDGFQDRTSRALDISLPPADRVGVAKEMREYMRSLVRRHRADPGEEMLGMLVREHGDQLDDDELTSIGNLLLIAGHETTANMLGIGTFALLTHPEQLAWLREHPDRIQDAVEELMRYLSVAPGTLPRRALVDVELSGQVVKAGEVVVTALATANRDPELLAEPERLDLSRKPTSHLAFGHGAHHCLGAPLARAEMRTAFPALLTRFPDLRLAIPAEEVRFRAAHAVYGVAELPVTW